MNNDDYEYQKFMAKTMNAAREFVEDYNNLSPYNQSRFQQELQNQVQFQSVWQILSRLFQR